MSPRLKVGVTLRSEDSSWLTLGTSERSIVIPGLHQGVPTSLILHYLDGSHTVSALADSLGLDRPTLEVFLGALEREGLLDTERTKIPYAGRYNSATGRNENITDAENADRDPAISNFLTRFEIESRGVTFLSEVRDGGRQAVIKRREFTILIFGSNRTALALFGILSASGFSSLRLIERRPLHHPSHHVAPSDLAGTFLGNSYLTRSKLEMVEELRRESSLFPNSLDSKRGVDLIIAFQPPPPESVQRWHSEETPYLLVDTRAGNQINIGPLVVPGKSPCFRCINLASHTRGQRPPGQSRSDEVDSEPPAALVARIAGIIASEIITYAHNGQSVFLATTSQYSINLNAEGSHTIWSIHPECGCQWS